MNTSADDAGYVWRTLEQQWRVVGDDWRGITYDRFRQQFWEQLEDETAQLLRAFQEAFETMEIIDRSLPWP